MDTRVGSAGVSLRRHFNMTNTCVSACEHREPRVFSGKLGESKSFAALADRKHKLLAQLFIVLVLRQVELVETK